MVRQEECPGCVRQMSRMCDGASTPRTRVCDSARVCGSVSTCKRAELAVVHCHVTGCHVGAIRVPGVWWCVNAYTCRAASCVPSCHGVP